MANCPICQASVPDDFGLIECGQCGAPLIVHMDGRVEHSGSGVNASEPVDEPAENLNGDEAPVFDEPMREFDLEPAQLEGIPEGVFPPVVPMTEEAEAETQMMDLSALEPEEPAPTSPVTEAEPEVEGSFHFAAEEQPPGEGASPDLSDIARFGNSDVSNLREGSLRYKVTITGIDTSDVREAFREAITDRKMMWDTEQILRSIKNGEVELLNVSPVKAYILVARIRDLPVHVRWEQYAVSQT